ncbi:rCG28926, partial [Rattus norvegicus]
MKDLQEYKAKNVGGQTLSTISSSTYPVMVALDPSCHALKPSHITICLHGSMPFRIQMLMHSWWC